MLDEPILPVEEMIAYEEFTDRVEILRELEQWVKNIQRMTAPSTALIAPRRLGKTVLLDRLVNTVFFKPTYRVAPFYFRMRREEISFRAFLLEYASTFFRQYIAYCLQDPLLYRREEISLENLAQYQSNHRAVQLAQEFAINFLERYNSNDYRDTRNHWDAFITIPERLASYSGTRVAVIIDEFQDMKFYIQDINPEDMDQVRSIRQKDPDRVGIDLTATFDRQAQSRKAPMLVSGSAVTMIFRTVMGGPLGGRFGFKYLKPLSVADGATLLQTLVRLYADNKPISAENALYASAQVGGHPYYLYCLSVSDFDGKQFDRQAAIDDLIQYEIERGKIYGFWQTHFDNNRRYINADDDETVGKKIIYYFTKYNNQPVDVKAIAQQVNIPRKVVEQKIEKLYLADLVYRSAAKYYSFNDICLMRFIKFVYEQDLEDVEAIDLSQQGMFNQLKGRFLEVVVQITMMKFNRERLAGQFFGVSAAVEVPLFAVVETKYAKASTTPSYQLDLCGQSVERDIFWVAECKYTKQKMGLTQVQKFEAAVEAFKQQLAEEGRTVPQMQLWLISTGGFTAEVLRYVAGRTDVYHTDHAGVNGLFRAYGGNYNIPIFTEAIA